MPEHKTSIKTLWLFKSGREKLIAEIRDGVAPDEFFYGCPYEDGSVLWYSEGQSKGWLHSFFRRLSQIAGMFFGIGINLSLCWAAWDRAIQAGVLVATNESQAFPFLFLKKLGIFKPKVVVICQTLHRIRDVSGNRFLGRFWCRCFSSLLREASTRVVFGEGDKLSAENALGEWCPGSFTPIQFGIDADFWKPSADPLSEDKTPYILSVGSDPFRDYSTLLQAVPDGVQTRIVTRLKCGLTPSHVVVDGNVSWIELRDLYRSSRLVVIAVKNIPRDCGHSAVLQAMACGKAVIYTANAGLWDKENMRHGDNCWLVAPEDPSALREAVQHLWERKELCEKIGAEARQTVERLYSKQVFADGMKRVIDAAYNE